MTVPRVDIGDGLAHRIGADPNATSCGIQVPPGAAGEAHHSALLCPVCCPMSEGRRVAERYARGLQQREAVLAERERLVTRTLTRLRVALADATG